MNLTPSEQKTFEKARTQVRALRYQLSLSALRELLMGTERREPPAPRLAVKLERR